PCGGTHVMRCGHASDPEGDHNQRSYAPPVFPQRAEAMTALKPGPTDAEQHERRTQRQADAPHIHKRYRGDLRVELRLRGEGEALRRGFVRRASVLRRLSER